MRVQCNTQLNLGQVKFVIKPTWMVDKTLFKVLNLPKSWQGKKRVNGSELEVTLMPAVSEQSGTFTQLIISMKIGRSWHPLRRYEAHATAALFAPMAAPHENYRIGKRNTKTICDFPDLNNAINFRVNVAMQQDVEKTHHAVLKLVVEVKVKEYEKITCHDCDNNFILVELIKPEKDLSTQNTSHISH